MPVTSKYVVRALNARSFADSAPSYATTGIPGLEMPENLAAKASRGYVTLTWTDTNSGEDGYEVLRAEGDAEASPLATAAADSTKYVDGSVIKGRVYKYQVRAYRSSLDGPPTSPLSVTAR